MSAKYPTLSVAALCNFVVPCLSGKIPSDCAVATNTSVSSTGEGRQTGVEISSADSSVEALLERLVQFSCDEQERGWKLHGDLPQICETVAELISLMPSVSQPLSTSLLSSSSHRRLHALVTLYQLESERSLRHLLCELFALVCAVSSQFIRILLHSPLVADIVSDIVGCDVQDDISLSTSATLLLMLLSMGDEIPQSHIDSFGCQFVEFLLSTIEGGGGHVDISDNTSDILVSLILALNLCYSNQRDNLATRTTENHFCTTDDDDDNKLMTPVIATIIDGTKIKTFTEKCMLLINRQEDPVRIFQHVPAPQNSLLALFTAIYSCCRQRDGPFYTNDVEVLVGIVLRNISDLSSGDHIRTQYLTLCSHLVGSRDYQQCRLQRRQELCAALAGIEDGEAAGGDLAARDAELARCILSTISAL